MKKGYQEQANDSSSRNVKPSLLSAVISVMKVHYGMHDNTTSCFPKNESAIMKRIAHVVMIISSQCLFQDMTVDWL